jgi:hypothetical protein
VKEILFNLADQAADIARVNRMTRAAIYIQKCWRRKLVYRRYAKEIEYLKKKRIERLHIKMAKRIQKNWRLVRWKFRIRRIRAASDIIRKNFLAYIWRKNYLKMKNGMIKIQRMFRMNKDRFDKGKLDYYLRQSKFEDLLSMRKFELLKTCHESLELILEREHKKEMRLQEKVKPGTEDLPRRGRSANARAFKTLSGVPRLRLFSLLVDFNSFPNISFLNFGDYFNGFKNVFGKLSKYGETPIEYHCADTHLFTLSDKFRGYYWGDCEFIYRKVLDRELRVEHFKHRQSMGINKNYRKSQKEKEWREAVHCVSFWGRKPIGINSGNDFCCFLYPGILFNF